MASLPSALGSRASRLFFRPALGATDARVRPGLSRTASVAALLALGAAWGAAVAFAGPAAAVLCVAAVACVFVLRDFRVGVVAMVLIMPISQSSVFPREMMGITGLNPLNLLLATTLFSFFMRALGDGSWRAFLPRPVLFLLLLPMAVAAALGARHVGEIPGFFRDFDLIMFDNAVGYVRDMLLRPLTFVFYALLAGMAVLKSERPEKLVTPIVFSVLVMAGLVLAFTALSGASLSQLAGEYSRQFFSDIGMHANDLGRLYATAYALLLFTWDRSDRASLRAALLVAMGATVLALLLTFSRGAFLGFILVNLVYLFSRRKSKIMLLAIPAIPVALYFVPGAVWYRMSLGFGVGLNEISAGRVDDIWAPLLPHLLTTPPWGNGLGAILWSPPMIDGRLMQVAHPHNAYFQAWLDLGAIGFVLLLSFWILVWRRFRELQRDPRLGNEMQGLFEGAAAGLLAFLLAGFAGSSLMPVAEQVFLWLAAGMMFGMRARFARET